jgi:hypothetical protein
MELFILVIGLVVLGLLAHRFGYDSRDSFGATGRGVGESTLGWSNPFYDRELARETLEARQRRMANSQAADAQLQPVDRSLPHAA